MSEKLNIHIPEALVAPLSTGAVGVAAGDYSVLVAAAAGSIVLSPDGSGADLSLPATRRDSKMRVNKDSVQLFSVEREPAYLLVVRTPPNNEWVARLDRPPSASNGET